MYYYITRYLKNMLERKPSDTIAHKDTVNCKRNRVIYIKTYDNWSHWWLLLYHFTAVILLFVSLSDRNRIINKMFSYFVIMLVRYVINRLQITKQSLIIHVTFLISSFSVNILGDIADNINFKESCRSRCSIIILYLAQCQYNANNFSKFRPMIS